MTTGQPQYFTCVYDPEETYSGSYLHGHHFAITLAVGYFPENSVWFRQPPGDLVVVKPVDRNAHPRAYSHQTLESCPENTLGSLPLSSRRLIQRCRQT